MVSPCDVAIGCPDGRYGKYTIGSSSLDVGPYGRMSDTTPTTSRGGPSPTSTQAADRIAPVEERFAAASSLNTMASCPGAMSRASRKRPRRSGWPMASK